MSSSSSYSKAYKASVSDLHIVMGHPSKSISARLQIPNPPHLCQDCLAGRFVKSKPKISSTSVSRPLELLHADICGPFPHTGINGEKYFLVIVDRFTHITSSYCLKVKSEATDLIRQFINKAETQLSSYNCKVITLRTDNGGEFVNKSLEAFLASKGITQELTVAHSSHQNGDVLHPIGPLLFKWPHILSIENPAGLSNLRYHTRVGSINLLIILGIIHLDVKHIHLLILMSVHQSFLLLSRH
ncbi:hypothetical protein KL941_005419 [Ogataea angusta]|nr:hypothetical protein KL941_005419 [Ogataea angusta]